MGGNGHGVCLAVRVMNRSTAPGDMVSPPWPGSRRPWALTISAATPVACGEAIEGPCRDGGNRTPALARVPAPVGADDQRRHPGGVRRGHRGALQVLVVATGRTPAVAQDERGVGRVLEGLLGQGLRHGR